MPACKLQTRAAAGIPGSTVVTVMARNGTDFGIQTAGTGDTWFTAPANTPEGLFLGSYGPDDANPDIGDSAITETAGHRRAGDGDRAGDRPVRRRLGAGRAGHHAADVRHHASARTPPSASRSWSSAARPPASTSPRSCAAACCRRSTPGWPAGSPAPARSAPASSRPRWPASPRPSTPSPPPPVDPGRHGRDRASSLGRPGTQVAARALEPAAGGAPLGRGHQRGRLAEPERRHVAVDRLVLPRPHEVGLVPDAGAGVLADPLPVVPPGRAVRVVASLANRSRCSKDRQYCTMSPPNVDIS